MKAYGKFMAKIAVIGIGIYLFCQSAAFWGEAIPACHPASHAKAGFTILTRKDI